MHPIEMSYTLSFSSVRMVFSIFRSCSHKFAVIHFIKIAALPCSIVKVLTFNDGNKLFGSYYTEFFY